MTNLEKLDAVQKVIAAEKVGTLQPQDALDAIDKIVNPNDFSRRDAQKFKQKLYNGRRF